MGGLATAREGAIVVPGLTSGWRWDVSPIWLPPLVGVSGGGGGAAPSAGLLGGSSAPGAGRRVGLLVLRPPRSLARGVGRGVAGGGVWLGAAGRWRGGLVGWLVEFIAR